MRIRFLGAAKRDAARAFNNHGGGCRFLWNAAVKYISTLRPEQKSAAYNADLLCKRFINERLYATKELKPRGADESEEAFESRKRKRDDKLGKVAEIAIGGFVHGFGSSTPP
jgi:hypothetical protein